jgi:hypothetical protein
MRKSSIVCDCCGEETGGKWGYVEVRIAVQTYEICAGGDKCEGKILALLSATKDQRPAA